MEQQTCAICLENLLPRATPPATTASKKVGAVVPCGHVFHDKCYQRWYAAQRRRNLVGGQQQQQGSDSFRCKCPMCNVLCDNFVQIYLGGHSNCTSSSSNNNSSAGSSASEASAGTITTGGGGGDDESIRLLARTCHDSAKRLDRVKDKLNKYKKEHKSLEKKLEDERRHNGENLERTIERHAKERRAWKRQQARSQQDLEAKEEEKQAVQRALDQRKEDHRKDRRHWRKEFKKMELKVVHDMDTTVQQHLEQVRDWGNQKIQLQNEIEKQAQQKDQLHHEIDRTIELQVEERRSWERRFQAMEQELQQSRVDQAKAEARVAKAVQGIAQMQLYNDARRNQVQKLTKEKAALARQVEELQSTLDEEVVIVFE